jgi:hypothetical protein
MPTGHRAIFRVTTSKGNRTLDRNRVYAAAEALIDLVEDMGRVGPGLYQITSGVVLAAKAAAIEAHDALQRIREVEE